MTRDPGQRRPGPIKKEYSRKILPMNRLIALPHLEPANTNGASQASSDLETKAALERERDRILHIANYTEAL